MISLILLFIAGIANAFMDIMKIWNSSRWDAINEKSLWYRWAGPRAWRNKWKPGKPGIERFLFSSTALVFVTDAWHFFQMIWRVCFTLAIVFYHPLINWWGDFILLSIAYLLAFNIFYEKILRK